MAPKKDNLPLTLDQDQDSTGTITYANEVVAVIAGVVFFVRKHRKKK